MPTLLAFDTATERLCIALVAGDDVLRHDGDGGAKASAALIPAALALLGRAGLQLSALDAVAFGRGPGAFTGLRTACAVAQGLAYGLGVPVLPLDSLQLVADDARAQGAGDELWVAMDARMDEAYAAQYRHDGRRWHTLTAPALYTLGALAAAWRAAPPRAIAGNACAAFGARLDAGTARRIDAERSRADALAALARATWADGPRLDPADALPLYLRDKVALTTAEREAAKALRRAMEEPAP
jgi:tRNA threonylcarbamoyladenosine biosynthesis protein TsaB